MEQDFAPHTLFFFPSVPKEKVAGYWGRGPVVFIAERPSNAPKARSQTTHISDRFHDVLKRHDFADAHVTDLIKRFHRTARSRIGAGIRLGINETLAGPQIAPQSPMFIASEGWQSGRMRRS